MATTKLVKPVQYYGENFGAQTGARAYVAGSAPEPAGSPIPPPTAQQWKLGAKAEFFDGRLRATLAYYDLAKQNIATTDTAHVAGGRNWTSRAKYLPGLNVIAAYANQDVRVAKSTDDVNGAGIEVGNRLQFTPRNIGSVWSTHEVRQGQFKGFKNGIGVLAGWHGQF
ncbi:MAG: TonB-dependent receptor [Methylobacter sp.]|nr:TonB-dependent receptor [Methylobacter sp.]